MRLTLALAIPVSACSPCKECCGPITHFSIDADDSALFVDGSKHEWEQPPLVSTTVRNLDSGGEATDTISMSGTVIDGFTMNTTEVVSVPRSCDPFSVEITFELQDSESPGLGVDGFEP